MSDAPTNLYPVRESFLRTLGRFVAVVAVIAVFEAAILGGICWWAGLDNAEDISSVLFIGGAAFALLGGGIYIAPRGSTVPVGGSGMGSAADVQRAGMLAEYVPGLARQDAIDARRGLGISAAIFVASGIVVGVAIAIAYSV